MAIGTGVLAFRIMAAPPRRTVSGNFAEIVWDKTSFMREVQDFNPFKHLGFFFYL